MALDKGLATKIAEVAFVDAEPTWEVIRLLMCRELHKLPSEIDAEKDEIIKLYHGLKIYDEYYSRRPSTAKVDSEMTKEVT
jgi:hypothetical protein